MGIKYNGNVHHLDWKLFYCNPESGKDYRLCWGDEYSIRVAMQKRAESGDDVWITDPTGTKHLPVGAPKATIKAQYFIKCGCGKSVRYETPNGMACNKHGRCLTREEAVSALRESNMKRLTIETALKELVSIAEIHSRATNNNFAWAEMEFAKEVLNNG